MKRDVANSEPVLTAVFVDYDNIYLSLKRKSEDAAKRFAKDAGLWLKAIEQGTMLTTTNGSGLDRPRRIVLNRCYGNPVPRRNPSDNQTDMNSFPFVRHHFLRSGFEVVDCPPLTAQLKNSSDIRMVMDVRDLLNHETYFDEFIILSGDADFTPVLHRLRAHARRTVIFANDYTAAPYTAISDGEIREADLIRLLVEGLLPGQIAPVDETVSQAETAVTQKDREDILATVVESIRSAAGPVPVEALADRAVRTLGIERTSGAQWAGAGTFRAYLAQNLPEPFRLTDQAPYYVYDSTRHGVEPGAEPDQPVRGAVKEGQRAPAEAGEQAMPRAAPLAPETPRFDPAPAVVAMPYREGALAASAPPSRQAFAQPQPAVTLTQSQTVPQAASAQAAPRTDAGAGSIQQAIARIYDACQAPPLGPTEYRMLFEIMANEINENKLSGAQTISNVLQRAVENKLRVSRDDVRFVFDVVSEVDPWFEQGAAAGLFAGRFRNFVIARCRSQGLGLSADDIDLIDRLFVGAPAQQPAPVRPMIPAQPPVQSNEPMRDHAANRQERWWAGDDQRVQAPVAVARHAQPEQQPHDEDFPRILRSRGRA